jgi:hypothetical protein
MYGTHWDEYYEDAAALADATEVVVTADQRTDGIDAVLDFPPPLIDVETVGAVSVDPVTGEVTIQFRRGQPADLTITRVATCPDDATPTSVTLRLTERDGTTTDYPMTQQGNTNRYTTTIPAAEVREGDLSVLVECPEQAVVETPVGGIVLYDPSGVITNAITGDPVDGATVTLFELPDWTLKTGTDDDSANACYTVDNRPDIWENLDPVSSMDNLPGFPAIEDSGRIDPAVNPQTTGADGRYGWDVAGGCWYIVVQAEGYTTRVSPAVGVPPEVTDLDLTLEPLTNLQNEDRLYLPIVVR